MKDVGFKNADTFSVDQLITLIVFSAVVMAIAFLLRKNKTIFKRYFPTSKLTQRYSVEVQKIDGKTSVYHLADKSNEYTIFRSPDGVVLLNKEKKGKGINE